MFENYKVNLTFYKSIFSYNNLTIIKNNFTNINKSFTISVYNFT